MMNKLMVIYRLALGALFVLFLCSIWAAERTAPGTNATVAATSTAPSVEKKTLSFGLDRVDFLQESFFGIPGWQYTAFFIYVLLALFVSKALDFLVGVQMKRLAARTETKLDDLVISVVHGPVKIIAFVILLNIGLEVFAWPPWVEVWFARGLYLVVAWSITYMAWRLVDMLVAHWKGRGMSLGPDKAFNEQLFPIISKSLKIFLVLLAVMMTAQNLGLNITGLLASLSIGGLALGLAAQDTVANLFGAVAVFVDKPFQVGDFIKVADVEGTVETIGLRSTRVRNPDGNLITVPNKTMGNAIITNVTRRPTIRTMMNIGITYDTPAAKVKEAVQILEEIYRADSMTHDVIVSFNKFGDSALNIQVLHWWKSGVMRDYLDGFQELNLAIKERFDKAGIEFAFPTQTVYLKQETDG